MPELSEEFFIGYLPAPMRLRRFLRVSMLASLLLAVMVAMVFAIAERDPGDGQWHPDDPRDVIGTVFESPVPMLHARRSDGSTETSILVSEGKVGAAARVAGTDGKVAKLRGTRIERGPLVLFEIADAGGSVAPTNAGRIEPPSPVIDPMPRTLRGEIIDPKCHAGAMKPGDGKAHKACATLCIRGGIPPMFLDESGQRYVLLDSAGLALTGHSLDAILPFVADHVEIDAAVVQRQGDLKFLRIDPARLRRLTL
jgi:hypothetical protein